MTNLLEKKVSLWNNYQLTRKSEDLLVLLNNFPSPPSSERLANAVNRPPQTVGRTMKNLAQKGNGGLVENVSTHRGRFAWALTPEGREVVSIIEGIRK